MPEPSCPPHPDAATLRLFAIGRLSGEMKDRVERHLGECRACVLDADFAPGDRLVDLLRREPPVAADPASSARRGERAARGPNDHLCDSWASEDRK